MASVSARGISSVVARRAMHSTNAARQSVAATTAAGNANAMISLEKIDARVFCLGTKGGNPVTIFASPTPLPGSIQQKLATTCDWESVVVVSAPTPTMSFFMPSGEEVSFCAHAAIGGAIAMRGTGKGGSRSSRDFQASMTGEPFTVDSAGIGDDEGNNNEKNQDENNGPDDNDGSSSSSSKSCCLRMREVRFNEAPLSQAAMTTLEKWSDRLDWSSTRSPLNGTPRNASVARPKTLVELASVEALQKAGTPSSDDGSFANACEAMDDSTGVYLYAPRQINRSEDGGQKLSSCYEYECRQFPRSSGYPEDPATGIAAAALAASLQFGGGSQEGNRHLTAAASNYEIYQGTAMGRPSLIEVVNLQKDENSGRLSFGLQGRVEIDATSTIQVSE